MKYVYKYAFLWLILGMCYSQLELFFRGYTYIQMTFIGGLAGVFIGLLDQYPAYYNRMMWQQCFLGTLIVVGIELCSGCLCNKLLRLHIWDYSCVKYNLLGQVCVRAALAWFFLCPFAIWMDDFLRFKFFGEKDPGSPLNNYKRLFTLK